MNILYLVLGGAAGTLARYYVVHSMIGAAGSKFPWGTLLVNWIGCAIIGALAAEAGGKWDVKSVSYLWLVAGFCGAFTTFSAFIFDVDALARAGSQARVFAYLAASLIGGYTFFLSGGWVVRKMISEG